MSELDSSSFAYPDLPVDVIMSLRALLNEYREKGVSFIDESPYPDIVKQTLKVLFGGSASGSGSEKGSGRKLDEIDYESETIALYDSINEIDDLEIDPKERISLIKLKTSILQQLLDMMKESRRIKQINRFEETVYGLLTDEQKNKILEL